jgi:hypothetical protein
VRIACGEAAGPDERGVWGGELRLSADAKRLRAARVRRRGAA